VVAGAGFDARSLAAVHAAGVAAARIGTRFIAANESGAHPDYVSAVLRAGPSSTEITDAFAVCPLCATLPRARVLSCAVRAVAALDDEKRGHRGGAGAGGPGATPRRHRPDHRGPPAYPNTALLNMLLLARTGRR
jgi:nitronate monooxygenase